MTDYQAHAEILSAGPGKPAKEPDRAEEDRWSSEPATAEIVEPEPEEDAEAAEAEPGPWREVLRSLFGSESLAVTGFVLALLSCLVASVLLRLAATMAAPDSVGIEGPQIAPADLSQAVGVVTIVAALLGVAAGIVALRRAEPGTGRGIIGLAGAAVLIGVLAAAAHLVIATSGGAGLGYYF